MIRNYLIDKINPGFSSIYCSTIEPVEDTTTTGDETTKLRIGGLFRFSEGDGPPKRVQLLSYNENSKDVDMYNVCDGNGVTYYVKGLNLIAEEDPDISCIPQTTKQYGNDAKHLDDAALENIANPKILSPEQQELLSLHNRLDHLPFPRLIKMAEQGKVPRRFGI